MHTFLATLQTTLVTVIKKLLEDQKFENQPARPIRVLAREDSGWKSRLMESIQIAYSTAIVVLPPVPLHMQSNTVGFACDQIRVVLQVLQPSLFAYYPLPMSIATMLAHHLNRFELVVGDWVGCLELVETQPLREVHDPLSPNHFIVEIAFNLSGPLPSVVLSADTSSKL